MRVIHTELPEVLVLEPKVFRDDRGFFLESYNQKTLAEVAGITAQFVQDNHSRSTQNVLRGLHYQVKQPQGKLIRVISGTIFDVAVDIRWNSPRFGKWTGFYLSDENQHLAWIPPGFAHGFLVISKTAEVLYKATDFYAPEHERSILWNDPKIGIDWPLLKGVSPILSAKDEKGAALDHAELY